MVKPYLVKLNFFVCFDQNIISIKCQIKRMAYTVLSSHAYDDVLVTQFFCTTTNFSRSYICTHSDFLNSSLFNATLWGQFWKKRHFSNKIFWEKEMCHCKKIGNVIWRKAFLTGWCATLRFAGYFRF